MQTRIISEIQPKCLQDIFMFLFALRQERVLLDFLRLKKESTLKKRKKKVKFTEIKVKNG